MGAPGLFISLGIIQNIIIYQFLAPWGLFEHLSSTRRCAVFTVAITIMLGWIAFWYTLVYRFILIPLELLWLQSLVMVVLLAVSSVLLQYVGSLFFSFSWIQYRRAAISVTLNVTVFIIPMVLAASDLSLAMVVIAGIFTGIGLLIFSVPIAALQERLSLTNPLHDPLTTIFLTLALFALGGELLTGAITVPAVFLW